MTSGRSVPAQALHAADRRLQPRQRRRRDVDRHVARQQDTENAQQILRVEVADHRRREFGLAPGRVHRQRDAVARHPDVARRDVAGGKAVGQKSRATRAHAIDQALPEWIVGIDDGRAQTRRREEFRLRSAIRRHRVVIVEVVAREIGEQCDIELDAADAALLQAVRRNFHRHGFRTRAPELLQQLVQRGSVRRRMRCRRQRADQAVAQRAQMPARRPHASNAWPIQCAHDVLPFVPCDADHPQRLRRTAIDEIRDRAEPSLQALDRQMREPPSRDPTRSLRTPTARRSRRGRSHPARTCGRPHASPGTRQTPRRVRCGGCPP
jgi:hypothetical protein